MKGLIDYLVDLFRRLIRPLATVWLLVLLGHCVTTPGVSDERVRDVFILALIAMVFWFGERAFKALGLDINQLILARMERAVPDRGRGAPAP